MDIKIGSSLIGSNGGYRHVSFYIGNNKIGTGATAGNVWAHSNFFNQISVLMDRNEGLIIITQVTKPPKNK